MKTPSVGRIVLFFTSDQSRHPGSVGPFAALITGIAENGGVILRVFPPYGEPYATSPCGELENGAADLSESVTHGWAWPVISGPATPNVVLTPETHQPAALTFDQTSLSPAQVGSDYAAYLTVDGGLQLVNFWLDGGDSLPAGLMLYGDGVLEGVPQSAGSFSFTVVAAGFGLETRQTFSLSVAAAPVVEAAQAPAPIEPASAPAPEPQPGGETGSAEQPTASAEPGAPAAPAEPAETAETATAA